MAKVRQGRTVMIKLFTGQEILIRNTDPAVLNQTFGDALASDRPLIICNRKNGETFTLNPHQIVFLQEIGDSTRA